MSFHWSHDPRDEERIQQMIDERQDDPQDPDKLNGVYGYNSPDPEYITPPGEEPTEEEQEEFDSMWLEGETITEDGYVSNPDSEE